MHKQEFEKLEECFLNKGMEHFIDQKLYDSTADSLKHIKRVGEYINRCIKQLLNRAETHDASVLLDPLEKSAKDLLTPEFRKLEYGSEAYYAVVNQPIVREAAKHHHIWNSHHTEHYPNGVNGMCLIDVLEMLCDWKAATDRNPTGNFNKNLEVNIVRFNIEPQLAEILRNTAKRLKFI